MWQLTQLMRIKSVRHNISFYITEYPWILVPEHFIKDLWGQETQYLILKTELFFFLVVQGRVSLCSEKYLNNCYL